MPKRDIHQEITDKIIKELEAGTPPWKRGWTKKTGGMSGLPLRVTGQPYAGINGLLLWGAAADAGYSAPHWMTFKQAKELGGCVRKGERGTGIVFDSNDEDAEPTSGTITAIEVRQGSTLIGQLTNFSPNFLSLVGAVDSPLGGDSIQPAQPLIDHLLTQHGTVLPGLPNGASH